MGGGTDTVFRRLIRSQGGCGLMMTEFTSSHGVLATARHNPLEWLNPDKRIPPHMLATLHRLQQKRVRLFFCDREKGRDRREQIGAHRFHHRHQRRRTRQA